MQCKYEKGDIISYHIHITDDVLQKQWLPFSLQQLSHTAELTVFFSLLMREADLLYGPRKWRLCLHKLDRRP